MVGEVVADESELGFAEGQTFVIEYVDAGGRPSTRVITVRDVFGPGGDKPMLFAYCHTRKAMRNFRVDRIKTIADLNGEIYEDPAGFLVQALGMSEFGAADVGLDYRAEELVDAWPAMRKRIRVPATLLATISHADGEADITEINMMMRYCLELCPDLPTDRQLEKNLFNYLRRMRPSESMVNKALGVVGGFSHEEKADFLVACRELIEADGEVHPMEIEMLDAMSQDLIGIGLDGWIER